MFRKYFKRLAVSSMKKTGLNGYAHEFSVDYNIISVNITDIHECLLKKHNIK